MTRAPLWIGAGELESVLDRWASEVELVAPVRLGEEVVFRPVEGADEICSDYVNSLVPPKVRFLPTPEQLLSYRLTEGIPRFPEPGAGTLRPSILFGIRSCDVAGLAYLDRFFSGEIFGRADTADLPYLRRRAATTLVSVACQEPGDTCLCVCCRGGPALQEGFDWQLTELSSGWFVEIGSARGEELAQAHREHLRPAEENEARERNHRLLAAVERLTATSTHRVQTMACGRLVSSGRLGREFWDEIGHRCFECGSCAFVCPTCSCFTVADVQAPGSAPFEDPAPAVPASGSPPDGEWERTRYRDCCQLAGFVRVAGGGYPRGDTGARCQTRFFHKMSWQFTERMGTPGCTGCGRCILACPAGNGISRVSERMTATLTAGAERSPRWTR